MIQLSNISKKFGETQAVEGISLMIPDGSVFGLLGSNGAGKSTLLRMMAGILKEGKCVMMVGDGINDAPALVQADVGVAIGSGSDIALDSSDIVLMKSNLQDVYKAIRLSKATIRNIKQNLFWAFFYNACGLPLAAGALYAINGTLLNPIFAGLAMSLSSVCVVGNALRLKTTKLD